MNTEKAIKILTCILHTNCGDCEREDFCKDSFSQEQQRAALDLALSVLRHLARCEKEKYKSVGREPHESKKTDQAEHVKTQSRRQE